MHIRVSGLDVERFGGAPLCLDPSLAQPDARAIRTFGLHLLDKLVVFVVKPPLQGAKVHVLADDERAEEDGSEPKVAGARDFSEDGEKVEEGEGDVDVHYEHGDEPNGDGRGDSGKGEPVEPALQKQDLCGDKRGGDRSCEKTGFLMRQREGRGEKGRTLKLQTRMMTVRQVAPASQKVASVPVFGLALSRK